MRVLERQAAHLRVSVSRTGASPPALSDVFAAVEAVRAPPAAALLEAVASAGGDGSSSSSSSSVPPAAAPRCPSIVAYQVSQTSLEQVRGGTQWVSSWRSSPPVFDFAITHPRPPALQVFLDLADKGGGGGEEDHGPWAEAREAFAARAIFFHLVVAPCTLLVRWGLILGLAFIAVFLLALPPLGACMLRLLARMVQWRARVDSGLLSEWAQSSRSRASRGAPVPVAIAGAAPDRAACYRCRVSGCCGLWEGGLALLGDPAARSALAYLLALQPLVVFLCLGASALTLVVGVASLIGFVPSLTVQKRLAIWHRDISARFLCSDRGGRGGAQSFGVQESATHTPLRTAAGVLVTSTTADSGGVPSVVVA